MKRRGKIRQKNQNNRAFILSAVYLLQQKYLAIEERKWPKLLEFDFEEQKCYSKTIDNCTIYTCIHLIWIFSITFIHRTSFTFVTHTPVLVRNVKISCSFMNSRRLSFSLSNQNSLDYYFLAFSTVFMF